MIKNKIYQFNPGLTQFSPNRGCPKKLVYVRDDFENFVIQIHWYFLIHVVVLGEIWLGSVHNLTVTRSFYQADVYVRLWWDYWTYPLIRVCPHQLLDLLTECNHYKTACHWHLRCMCPMCQKIIGINTNTIKGLVINQWLTTKRLAGTGKLFWTNFSCSGTKLLWK